MIEIRTDLLKDRLVPSMQVAGAFYSRYLKIWNLNANVILAEIPKDETCSTNDHTLGLTKQLGPGEYIVFIDFRRPLHEVLRTFAHEMVHVAQFMRGHLQCKMRHGKEILLWRGKRVPASVSYLNRPWEKLAFSKQELMVRHLAECMNTIKEK